MEHAFNIFSSIELGEKRDILFSSTDEGIRLVEVTEGDLTEEIYDTRVRESEVLVRDEHAFLDEFDLEEAGLKDGLAAWFGEENQLSDLMDRLDGAGVPYEFRQRLGEGIVTFRADGGGKTGV